MPQQKFISFEGIDGSGKSTQAKLLADALRNLGYTVVETREPGGTPIGEEIRKVLFGSHSETITNPCQTLLFAASRAQLVNDVIRPALDAGHFVICDRYADSTWAYQGGGYQQSTDPFNALHQYATGGLWPDVTFLLDVSPFEAMGRKYNGLVETNRMDTLPYIFHLLTRERYLSLAAGSVRWRVLNGNANRNHIHELILKELGVKETA